MGKLSPAVAALLSLLLPGAGQIALGRRTRGLSLLAGALIYIALLLFFKLSWPYWLCLLPLWLMAAQDAYRLAGGQRPRSALLIAASVLPLYVLGWQATDINVQRLLSNGPKVRPVIAGLFKPNIVVQERDIEVASQTIYVPCPAGGEVRNVVGESGGTISVDETCANIGDTIVLRGNGFPTDKPLELWWVNPVNARRRLRIFGGFGDFNSAPDGTFSAPIEVPNAMPANVAGDSDQHRIEVRYVTRVGGWHITETARLIIQRMGETIAQALMATFIGALLAMPFSFFGARNLMAGNPALKILYYLSRTVMNVLRSVEPLIMAIVFVVWVGLGPFAGVLALIVHTIAALGKLYSESIESIDQGPIEAIRATGANPLQVIAYGVVPQVIPPWIAFTVYRWDINVRMSTIIGFVGGGGIGFLLAQWIRLSEFRSAGAAIWTIAVVVIILDFLSARVRERLL